MQHLKTFFSIFMIMLSLSACLQDTEPKQERKALRSGASQIDAYLPLLQDKNIGLIANHSSLVGNTHLADTLLSLGVNVTKIYAPEHGFRGLADAGAHIEDGRDLETGLPVISLYGSNRKPTQNQLEDVDLLLFDLQDVGVRFYTYISTLAYIMEAAAEKGIPVIVLDRPNPNGFYIDGPVLEKEFTSFVGMHPVPIVYGMTIGEYGKMVNGEYWLADSSRCDYSVIPLKNYVRDSLYALPVKPSPNLPNWQSIYLYPSLCLFEGTVVSVGRGTESPFTIFGHPDFMIGSFVFTPKPGPGAAHPKLEGMHCYGHKLTGYANSYKEMDHHLNLDWLISAYDILGQDSSFFIPYFNKLAGNSSLKEQIRHNMSADDIRKSWEKDLDIFKETRGKYLIYKD